MAFPTLAEVRAAAVAWFKEPGRPRLASLRARLAALITPPDSTRSSVTVDIRVDPGPVYTLVATVYRWDASGNQLAPITREWTPDVTDRPNFDLLDCSTGDGEKRSIRQVQLG